MERSELERELARLHPDSWGWALGCCAHNRERAEEALQTAYLRILSGTARYEGRSSIKTWVFGVIRVTAMEQHRRRTFGAGDGDGEAMTRLADPSPGADVATELSERSAALVAALARLSPRQSEVLRLVFYHDMTIEDAAGVMKVSLGAARTHYERGKQMLRRLLGGEDTRERA